MARLIRTVVSSICRQEQQLLNNASQNVRKRIRQPTGKRLSELSKTISTDAFMSSLPVLSCAARETSHEPVVQKERVLRISTAESYVNQSRAFFRAKIRILVAEDKLNRCNQN